VSESTKLQQAKALLKTASQDSKIPTLFFSLIFSSKINIAQLEIRIYLNDNPNDI